MPCTSSFLNMFDYLKNQYFKLIFYREEECKKLLGCEGVGFYGDCLMYKSNIIFIHVQNTTKDHKICLLSL